MDAASAAIAGAAITGGLVLVGQVGNRLYDQLAGGKLRKGEWESSTIRAAWCVRGNVNLAAAALNSVRLVVGDTLHTTEDGCLPPQATDYVAAHLETLNFLDAGSVLPSGVIPHEFLDIATVITGCHDSIVYLETDAMAKLRVWHGLPVPSLVFEGLRRALEDVAKSHFSALYLMRIAAKHGPLAKIWSEEDLAEDVELLKGHDFPVAEWITAVDARQAKRKK